MVVCETLQKSVVIFIGQFYSHIVSNLWLGVILLLVCYDTPVGCGDTAWGICIVL